MYDEKKSLSQLEVNSIYKVLPTIVCFHKKKLYTFLIIRNEQQQLQGERGEDECEIMCNGVADQGLHVSA
jgi:hypothetical protein